MFQTGRYGYNGCKIGGGIPSEKLIEKAIEENPQRNLRSELHEIAKNEGIDEMLIALNKIISISYERKIEFLRDYIDHHHFEK
jgi:methanogenic corrinoid protein MtbC1